MRKRNRWSATIATLTLLLGLGVVSSNNQVARAVTTINQLGLDINGVYASEQSGWAVAMSADGNRIIISARANSDIAYLVGQVRVYTWNGTTWTRTGQEINGDVAGDEIGHSVAISADGNRIAIGARFKDSNGNDAGGHVRVYTWNGTTWTRTGSDMNGEATGDHSGTSVAMSADGNRIAIGAPLNDGNGADSGHVRVYTWNGTTWTKAGNDIDGEATNDNSGNSVAMSADGNRIVIGAKFNDGNGANSGHARVYTWNGTTWTKAGNDIDGEATNDNSGYSVAMSADGNRIAIGAILNNGRANDAGHVRAYTWNGTAWTKSGSDIDGEAEFDYLGYSVAMSADGNRIAIGAPLTDDGGDMAGSVRVHTWNGTAWAQTGATINGKATMETAGHSVAMAANGTRIAIGAPIDDGVSNGIVRAYAMPYIPDAPTISSVTAANRSLTVAFTPGANGGSPITNYKYSVDGTNYVALNPAATTSPFTISGLTNGTTYSITIKAVNGEGDSPVSNAVTGTPTAPVTTTTTTTTVVPNSVTTTIAPSAVAVGTTAPLPQASVAQVTTTTLPKRSTTTVTTTRSSAQLPTTTSTTVPVTTTTQLAKDVDKELIAGTSANQVSRLVKQAESNKGGALLIDGKPVPVDVRTTPSSITLTYRNASVEVKCFDKDGSEIALSDDNRFTLRHGDAIKVVATGFSPGSSINVAVFSDPVAFGEVTVGQQGTASQQWPIPNSINAGNHTLVASGDLADVEDTVFGLRIVVDEQSLVSRIASNTWTRIIIAFGIFVGLLIPANRRRRQTR
jgi:hypothetical protein